MGLLLSVLVACVGVVELLDLYRNFQRNYHAYPITNDLPDVRDKYLDDLKAHRDDIYHRLQEEKRAVKNYEVVPKEYSTEEILLGNEFRGIASLLKDTPSTSTNDQVATCSKHVEDIDIQFDPKLVSPLNRRKYLLTETRSRSPSPRRRFVVSEDAPRNLPRFTIKETSSEDSTKHFLVKGNDTTSAFPLPQQFVVSQFTPTPEEEISKALAEAYFQAKIAEKLRASTEDNRSRSVSPIPRRFDSEHEFRRSPSPYPASILPVPRNSLCSELLDNNHLGILEEVSPIPEKLESNHCSSEYWKRRVITSRHRHHQKKKRLRSVSPFSEPTNLERRKSKSESELKHVEQFPSACQSNSSSKELVFPSDEKFLNNLDGVTVKKKVTRSSLAKKSKKKRTLIDPFGAANSSSESGAASPDSGVISLDSGVVSPVSSDSFTAFDTTISECPETSPITSEYSTLSASDIPSLPSEFVLTESSGVETFVNGDSSSNAKENDARLPEMKSNKSESGEDNSNKNCSVRNAAGPSNDGAKPQEPFWVKQ